MWMESPRTQRRGRRVHRGISEFEFPVVRRTREHARVTLAGLRVLRNFKAEDLSEIPLCPCVLCVEVLIHRTGFEARGFFDERQVHLAGGAVALLGDDEFGETFEIGIVLLVNFFAKNKSHNVGVLLDRT